MIIFQTGITARFERLLSITEENTLSDTQHEALQRLLSRRETGYHLGGKGVNRDELYER